VNRLPHDPADSGDTPPSLAGPNGRPDLLDDVAAASSPPPPLRPPSCAHRAAARLVLLLLAHVLYAAGIISTGVPDYETGARLRRDIAR